VASAVAPPVTPKTTTSVDPLYAAAAAQAKLALKGETDPIQNEQAASDANFRQQETDSADRAAAVSKLLAPIGPAVNGEYQTAAQNQELAANGFSHGMQDALQGNTDNLNAVLKSFGSPATLDSHAAEAGDVAYALGGYNPGVAFSKEGAAFGAAADLQSGDALLKGQQDVAGLKAKAIVADQGFQAKIAELAGKLPGNIETNYQKLQTMALQDAKFRETVANDKFNRGLKIAEQKLQVAKYQTSVQEFNVRQNLAERKFSKQTFQQNRMYAISMARLGIASRSLQLRAAAQEFKLQSGGLSAPALARANGSLQRIADSMQAKVDPDTGQTTYAFPKTKAELQAGKATATDPQGGYVAFIKRAIEQNVPLSLALERANTIFPETERPPPEALAGALGMTQAAAAAATNWKQAQSDYSQMTGTTLGTSPGGVSVTWQAPKNLPPTAKAKVSQVLNLASEYLGTPYAWGGESPTGFDCSGLAQYLYAKVGIKIPRTTYTQFESGLSVPSGKLQAGDLVFFKGGGSKDGLPGHVGIFVGGGMFVEAPHTGDVVKVSKLSGYPGYMGARRYVH
jgi:cell wall-associated NlpC family hydrolase